MLSCCPFGGKANALSQSTVIVFALARLAHLSRELEIAEQFVADDGVFDRAHNFVTIQRNSNRRRLRDAQP